MRTRRIRRTSFFPMLTTCEMSLTWTLFAAPSQARRRPAWRRPRALLGADQRDLQVGHRRRQSAGRSDLLFHDRRSRRCNLKRSSRESREAASILLNLAWSSVAALAMAPLQDVLNLGNDAPMNLPGRAEGNWRWRCTEEMLTPRAFQWLHDLTKTSNRAFFESKTLPEKQGERP